MKIFDCTDKLGNKIPEGCSECCFIAYRDRPDKSEYAEYCVLTKDEIGTFTRTQHDTGCCLSKYMKLSTCPLKEVKE